MTLQKVTDEQIRAILYDILRSGEKLRRKGLIERCVDKMGLDASALADHTPQSPAVQAKSRIGMLLSSAMHAGYIEEDPVGYLTLNDRQARRISQYTVRDCITGILRAQGTLSRRELEAEVLAHFGAGGDTTALRSVIGRALAELERGGHVYRSSRGLSSAAEGGVPANELGGVLRHARACGDLKTCFLDAIHTKGGEWFEVYCVSLLRQYFSATGKTVDAGSVTGGSDDGGIDGIIHTTDELGYRETILMQMKNRRCIMTAKDVREFYGAVCAENGSRGVFITISSFHSEAEKLLAKVDNLTGVDGDKLFEIACKCSLGVKSENGVLGLDEDLFLKT